MEPPAVSNESKDLTNDRSQKPTMEADYLTDPVYICAKGNHVSRLEKHIKRNTNRNGVLRRTAIEILQVALNYRYIKTSYELVQHESAIADSAFCYRVSIEDIFKFSAIGTGSSKRTAKESAARALIEQLTNKKLPGFKLDYKNCADDTVGNTVGLLQEMCITQDWPLPAYETKEIHLPHKCLFKIVCYTQNHHVEAVGDSKKIARRLAAVKMLEHLSNSSNMDAAANTTDEAESVGSENAENVEDRLPIQLLHDLCIKRRWPLPTYVSGIEAGPLYGYIFTVTCSLLNCQEIGKGKSKKLAKRFAAQKMWARFSNSSSSYPTNGVGFKN